MVFVDKLRRPTALAAAGLLLLASMVPLLASRTASAYTLLGDREIRMSTSSGGATDATYRALFDLSTGGDLGGIVITFCENTPIIGDTDCAIPAGFSVSATHANGDDAEGDVDVSGWSAAVSSHGSSGSGNNTFTLTNATPVTVSAGNTITFELTGVTNPSDIGTFYARIMTYESAADATGYTLADPEDVGPMVDAGGIALSTAESITIEAKVQERITFCVFVQSDPLLLSYDQNDCNAVNDPVVLGDVNGVLDSLAPSISKEAMFNITTNASNGATIRVTGTTLESGSFSIDAIGDTALASDEGTEQFGLCMYRENGGGVAGLEPVGEYTGGAGTECRDTTQGQGVGNDNGALFAFDTAATAPGPGNYGDAIATKTAGDWSTGVLVFLGNVSNVTEPGIYTTNLEFIATGNY